MLYKMKKSYCKMFKAWFFFFLSYPILKQSSILENNSVQNTFLVVFRLIIIGRIPVVYLYIGIDNIGIFSPYNMITENDEVL